MVEVSWKFDVVVVVVVVRHRVFAATLGFYNQCFSRIRLINF